MLFHSANFDYANKTMQLVLTKMEEQFCTVNSSGDFIGLYTAHGGACSVGPRQ